MFLPWIFEFQYLKYEKRYWKINLGSNHFTFFLIFLQKSILLFTKSKMYKNANNFFIFAPNLM